MKLVQPVRRENRFFSVLWFFMLSELCVLLMTGHGQAGESSPPPSTAKTTVLLRLKTSLNGRPADLSAKFLYGLAQVESGEFMHAVSPSAAPAQDAEGSWVYLELSSGTYHFWLIPPRTDLKRYRFQFVVPDGQPVVYIGTLQFNCWSKSAFFGHALDFCWDQTTVRDESALAQPVVTALAGKETPIAASLMTPYGLPPPKDSLSTLGPLSIVTRSGFEAVSADWSSRAPMKRSADAAVGVALMLLSPICAGYGGYLGIGFCFLAGLGNVVAGAHETHTELRQNEQVQNQWVACQKNLEQVLANFDGARTLHSRLHEWIKGNLPSTASTETPEFEPDGALRTQNSKSFIQVEILQILMRECRGRDSLCLELKVRARLWSAQEQRYLYDSVFFQPKSTVTPRWSGESEIPWLDLPFYNYDVPPTAPGHIARTIDAFCAEDGANLLREDVNAAIEASALRIGQHLGWQK